MEIINYIWILPLIYLGLYLFFVIAKSSKFLFIKNIDVLDKLIFCPVCGAFFVGFILGIFYFDYPSSILFFLGGGSAVGTAMYLNEEKSKKKTEFPFDFFLITLFFIMLGVTIILLIN